jgi:hypothetical protein
MVSSRAFYCNDMAHCFSPLLGQSYEWRVLQDHPLNRLHDCLEPQNVEVQVQIPNDSIAGCPSITRFRSPDGRVLVGAILRVDPGWTHHADAAGLDGRVQVATAPDLWVVFNGIPIRSCPRRQEARCSSRRLEDGFPDWEPL